MARRKSRIAGRKYTTARTRKGTYTRAVGYGNSNGNIGEFSRDTGIGKVIKSASIGGAARDSKGNQFGHNYTTLKDGTRVKTAEGTLTKRQKYYDRRTGLGMVGG